ncbi:RRQRL motif-containing zinc-binding protein [Streptomyces koyangensis]|uniref:RRQRL motif-containing zinc-binding protein n=1 Tax=Streptomyces koyangensis TaxID=188770 RepID=UPI003C2E2C5A
MVHRLGHRPLPRAARHHFGRRMSATLPVYPWRLAKPVRPMTPGRSRALAAALRARRICPQCRRDAGYCIPRSLGACVPCADNP